MLSSASAAGSGQAAPSELGVGARQGVRGREQARPEAPGPAGPITLALPAAGLVCPPRPTDRELGPRSAHLASGASQTHWAQKAAELCGHEATWRDKHCPPPGSWGGLVSCLTQDSAGVDSSMNQPCLPTNLQ